MTSNPLLDAHLATWLRPVGVDSSDARLAMRRAAVDAMQDRLAGQAAVDCVLAAHGILDNDARDWLGELIEEFDDEFDPVGKDGLLKHVAAASVAGALSDPTRDGQLLVALLVQSSDFIGAKPVVGPLLELAVEARAAAVGRQRGLSDALGERPTKRTARPTVLDEAAAYDASTMNKVLSEIRASVKQLSDRVDDVHRAASRSDENQREELETLWWSYSGYSSVLSKPWAEVTGAADRATRAAAELADISVAPPAASPRTLLEIALGDLAATLTTVRELASAACEIESVNPKVQGSSPLLPILSFTAHGLESGRDDDVWRVAASRLTGVEGDLTCTAKQGALQFLRELEITALL